MKQIQQWQWNNFERVCNEVVREALACGLNANDLKQMMALCWQNELEEMASRGAEELLATR